MADYDFMSKVSLIVKKLIIVDYYSGDFLCN